MQNNRVYSAASVTDVINLLKQHAFSGMLLIRRVADPHLEEARISIELGQPLQIRLGTHEDFFTNPTLAWLNSWGAIYFIFQPKTASLQLPPPQTSVSFSPSAPPASPALIQEPSVSPVRPRFSPAVTRPLPALSPLVRDQAETYTPRQTNGRMKIPDTPVPSKQSNGHVPSNALDSQAADETIPTLALEMAIPVITPRGRKYPVTQIPRRDRTIFLLINGQRNVADLAQLTRRNLQEVYATLYRLKKLDLIVVEV